MNSEDEATQRDRHLTRQGLNTMTPEDIVRAHERGLLDHLHAGGPTSPSPTQRKEPAMADPTADELRQMAERLVAAAEQARQRQLGSADIAAMSPTDVEAARQRGQFASLLAGDDPNPRTTN